MNRLLDKRVIGIFSSMSEAPHDLPFVPDTTHAQHTFEFALEYNNPGPRLNIYRIVHTWELFNGKFPLARIRCATEFGLATEREIRSYNDVPIDEMVALVDTAVAHTRAGISLQLQNEKISSIYVDFVDPDRVRPQLDAVLRGHFGGS